MNRSTIKACLIVLFGFIPCEVFGMSSILSHIATRAISLVKQTLNRETELKVPAIRGSTAYQREVLLGKLETLKMWLYNDRDAHINAQNFNAREVLHLASYNGHIEC